MPEAAATEGRGGRIQIGAVVAELREEFPDVSISKIRFLEQEGLVRPARARSGYRYFSAEDVERIRFVLRAQRDRFWPLRVIADALDAMDRGLVPEDVPGRLAVPDPGGRSPGADVPTARDLAPSRDSLRLTPAEVAAAAGLDAEYVAALLSYGLLRADPDGYLGGDALGVARSAARLADRGLEARHLRPFRLAAEREIALVEQTSRGARAGEERAATAEEIVQEFLALHAALVRAGLAAARR